MVEVTGPAGSWSGVSGVRDARTRGPVPADGRFRIAGISKVFSAAVVLQLAAEHKADLGRPVQDYLPGLPYGTPGSGDPAWFVQHRFDSWTPRQIVDEATTRPMRFAPGTQQQYNGTNYYVAGLLIEKVAGNSYADEVAAATFDPDLV